MTTILLSDDHHVVRQGIRAILNAEPGFEVVGESGDGVTTIKMVQKIQPDILVLDMMMKGLTGIEVIRQVSKSSAKTKIVVLSMYGNDAYVLEALRAGAKAYVLKESTATDLIQAIRETMVGHLYLSAALSQRIIEQHIQKNDKTTTDPFESLTVREHQIVDLAARGFTSANIAAQLVLSRRTVEVHRANAMRKLGLRNQTELLRYAMQRGIVPAQQ